MPDDSIQRDAPCRTGCVQFSGLAESAPPGSSFRGDLAGEVDRRSGRDVPGQRRRDRRGGPGQVAQASQAGSKADPCFGHVVSGGDGSEQRGRLPWVCGAQERQGQ